MRVRAEGDHLEVLKWARENDCPCHEQTRVRGGGGYLEVLKRLRENDRSWNTWTCALAAVAATRPEVGAAANHSPVNQ